MSTLITIIAGGRRETISARDGESLLDALRRAGWHIEAPCGGHGRCGKCVVEVDPPGSAGPIDEREARYTGGSATTRLACRSVPTDTLTVRVTEAAAPASADTTAKGGAIELPPTGEPVVLLEELVLDQPTLADQRSILARIRDASAIDGLTVPRELLARAAAIVAEQTGADATRIGVVIDLDEIEVIDVPRNLDGELLGLAVDIGTTTVAGYLVNVGTRQVVASRSEANAQAAYGADVISRIAAFGSGAPLHEAITAQLAGIAERLCDAAGVPTHTIAALSVVGNSTMIHLLLDLDPTSMSRSPFTPTLTEAALVPAVELGIPAHPRARLRVLPGVSAYVGADIVADLFSCGMHEAEGISLLVDIGTNGEMVIGGRDSLIACSTAAGPAFEGATIRYGSAGIPGAIDHVRRDGTNLIVHTIGEKAAGSICGTGLMDAVALLLDDGVVDETGRLDPESIPGTLREVYEPLLTTVDGEPAVILAGRDREPIVLTQGDVRQVQLAKGAIAAGVRVLLEEASLSATELRAVYLAGGFGTYVRPESAVRVGLLPGISPQAVVPLGNAAGAGAARALFASDWSGRTRAIVNRCRYVELSGSASFQEHYMEEMLFPPTS